MAPWLHRMISFFQRQRRRGQTEADLDGEVRAYYEMAVERLMERGLSREDAERTTRLRFGGEEQVKENTRDARTGAGLESWLRDLRYGWRSLLHAKAFALTVFFTIALCIGANTAMFAIVHSILLQPLPFPGADRVVLMANRYPGLGAGDQNTTSAADYYDRLKSVTALESQAIFRMDDRTVDVHGRASMLKSMAVVPSWFTVVRTAPVVGRAFTPEEDQQGNHHRVILSHSLARDLFGEVAASMGRSVRIADRPYTVVGVMPAGFTFIDPAVRLWIPMALSAEDRARYHSNNWYHIGRLKPGATLAQVQAQVDAQNEVTARRFPEFREILKNAGFHTQALPLQRMLVDEVESTVYLLWGGAMLVLLIGTLNLANLALARLSIRRKEMATRLALGAGRLQVIRQLVLEHVMITVAAGVAGIGLGAALLWVLPSMGLDHFPRAEEVHVGWMVALVALFLSAGVGLLIGLLPAVTLIDTNMSGALRDGNRSGTASRGVRRLRQALVGAEVGFAFVLLVTAGLLTATVRHLNQMNPGYATQQVLTVSTVAPSTRYPGQPALVQVMNNSLDALRRIPGVVAAGATDSVPLGGSYSNNALFAEGYALAPGESVIAPDRASVTPGYFDSMRIPLVRGRDFNEKDEGRSLQVAIVDEELANHFWPGQDPIGRRMFEPDSPSNPTHTDEKTVWFTVVGVVRNVHSHDLTGTVKRGGMYYRPFAQFPSFQFTMTARTRGDASTMEPAVRAAIREVDPGLALFDIHTMAQRAELSIAPRKMTMTLALGFGGVALLLSALGIYGVLAYLVAQRRREIGIRMALGGSARSIVQLVLGEGLLVCGAGLAAGLVGAFALRNVVAGQVFGLQVLDPLILGGVALLLSVIAMLACAIPARRAAQVNPVTVLSES